MHPLIVHFAVVLIPLCALLLFMALYNDSWRQRLGSWLAWMGGAAAIAGLLANSLGEYLLEHNPQYAEVIGKHDVYGGMTAAFAALMGLTAIIYWAQTSQRQHDWLAAKMKWLATPSALKVVRVLAVIFAVGAVVAVMLAGHTGAQAVWGR